MLYANKNHKEIVIEMMKLFYMNFFTKENRKLFSVIRGQEINYIGRYLS